MHQWLFDKEDFSDTPSVRDGIATSQEQHDRAKGCSFIIAVGSKLSLPQVVLATATTFFHRFYMRHSMKEYHIYDIGATCLFLSTKVEENTRKLRDIINACAQKAQKNEKLQLTEDSKDFQKWRNTIIFGEGVLLEAICFDMTVQHPHTCLIEFSSVIDVSKQTIRKAWAFLTHSLFLPLCLLYRPECIAAGALLLADQYLSEELPSQAWAQIGVDLEEAHDVAAAIIDYLIVNQPRRQQISNGSKVCYWNC
ncbi:hypothetical protein K450DRAFT_223892 [Umbelopsis ramanniana AG]|uniref:Cyclin-like domain-containing protein n=1 Tax=Umbelopsis ramanniana AG TaxID=1314678 RepID=A0AAD5EI61_UMBRA|nr:uncharacterized protein K450DRAFT_223892 [Umbelopsis ramanniana AG]KAI8583475.1 hypothetical protein K450DRAFT_223892 [Umbelopsis ramanniana AG]